MTIHNSVVGLLNSLLIDRGVAYPDFKPGNLVCTNDFRLQIIEFNTAVRVASEDRVQPHLGRPMMILWQVAPLVPFKRWGGG